jgi:hypothetical protein
MKKKTPKIESFTTNRIADLTGMDRMTVRRRLADVKLLRSRGKTRFYSAEDALRVLKPGQKQQSPNSALEAVKLQKQIESIEIENGKKRGELQPVADMRRAAVRFSYSVRDAIWSLPRRTAGRLSLLTDPVEIEEILQEEVRTILTDISKNPLTELHCPHCKTKLADAENLATAPG